jgi:hypothetical protein
MWVGAVVWQVGPGGFDKTVNVATANVATANVATANVAHQPTCHRIRKQ